MTLGMQQILPNTLQLSQYNFSLHLLHIIHIKYRLYNEDDVLGKVCCMTEGHVLPSNLGCGRLRFPDENCFCISLSILRAM
jgi:hypothetical protein